MKELESVLVKRQTKKFKRVYKSVTYHLTIRYDDNCNNGHNSFAMTYHVWNRTHTDYTQCGTNPELVAKVWPEYAKYLKWHLCSSDGPMHYIENTTYHASPKDYNGLLKGEKRQIKNGRTGFPAWELATRINGEVRECTVKGGPGGIDAKTCPPSPGKGLFYVSWCRIGEGKNPDLKAAQSCAIWPGATLEQLQDRETLLERLPKLREEFKSDVEELGFVY